MRKVWRKDSVCAARRQIDLLVPEVSAAVNHNSLEVGYRPPGRGGKEVMAGSSPPLNNRISFFDSTIQRALPQSQA